MRSLPRHIHVFGSGTFAADLCGILEHAGVCVEEVFDDVPSRVGRFLGSPPKTVKDLSTFGEYEQLPVAIGVSNLAADLLRIERSLGEAGARDVWTPVALYLALGEEGHEVADHYWMSTKEPRAIASRDGDLGLLERAPDFFADDSSRSLYQQQLAWRSSGALLHYVEPEPLTRLYDDEDLPIPRTGVRFLDLGAYTGDSIENLQSRGFDFDQVWAFEPDLTNYRHLVRTLTRLGIRSCALPLAAGNELATVRFSGDGTAAAGVSSEGGDWVTVVPVSNIVINEEPNYVKLDVEGHELPALEGLKPLLRRSRPTLAISAYHRPADLWQLPQFVQALDLDYSLHLRQYGNQGYDTVLYAIPL